MVLPLLYKRLEYHFPVSLRFKVPKYFCFTIECIEINCCHIMAVINTMINTMRLQLTQRPVINLTLSKLAAYS